MLSEPLLLQVAMRAAVRIVMVLIRTVSRTAPEVLWEVFEILNDVLLTLQPLVRTALWPLYQTLLMSSACDSALDACAGYACAGCVCSSGERCYVGSVSAPNVCLYHPLPVRLLLPSATPTVPSATPSLSCCRAVLRRG